jgi:hypothetical protein
MNSPKQGRLSRSNSAPEALGGNAIVNKATQTTKPILNKQTQTQVDPRHSSDKGYRHRNVGSNPTKDPPETKPDPKNVEKNVQAPKISVQITPEAKAEKDNRGKKKDRRSSKLPLKPKRKSTVHPSPDIPRPSRHIPKKPRLNNLISPTVVPVKHKPFILDADDLRESDLETDEEDDFEDDSSRESFDDAEGQIISVPADFVPIKPFPLRQRRSILKKCCSIL